MARAGANVWLGSAQLWYSHSLYVAPHHRGESHGWVPGVMESNESSAGVRECRRGGTGRGVEGRKREGDTWKPRLYTPAFTNLGTLPERAYRPCDVVTSAARSYARQSWLLFERYVPAPATDPCYTTRAIRDGRSFGSAIHASRYRTPPPHVFPVASQKRHRDPKVKRSRVQMDDVFF